MDPKKTSYEDYGIDLSFPDICPICDQSTLVINRGDESWFCSSKECGWRNRLRNSDRSQIMNAEDAAPALIRWHTTGLPEGMSWGWRQLDPYVKSLRGEWSVIVGYPGQGKSHLIDEVIVNQAMKGWRFAMYSPEVTPYERHVKNLAQKFLGKRFHECDLDEIRLAQYWLKENIYFIDPVEDTFEGVLAQFWKLIRAGQKPGGKKIHAVVIDPWNEVEHSISRGMTETQYTGLALKKFRRFCEAAHVHGYIVAHPAKIQVQRTAGDENKKMPLIRLYDISGSSHFANKAFNGISLWRNPMAEGTEKNVNKLYILKARNEDISKVGKCELIWDGASTGFYHDEDGGPRVPHAEEIKARFERLGGWRNQAFIRKPKEKADMAIRAIEWTKEPGQFTFMDDDVAASVRLVEGPGETAWAARIVTAKETLEDEFAVKEEALDWCERKAMEASKK